MQTFHDIVSDPLKTDAFGCVFTQSSDEARQQSDALMAAGWKWEIPSNGSEPWQWQWRSPPKRKGSKGKLHLSTNQAYRALQRSKYLYDDGFDHKPNTVVV